MRARARRAWELALTLMKQGVTAERIALCVALGVTISIFPVIVIPTLLCFGAAVGLRLNLPLITAVNYAATPLQWALLVPFVRFGERLFRAKPLSLSPSQITALVKDSPIGFLRKFEDTALHAVTGWLIISPLVLALFYFALLPIVRRFRPSERLAAARSGG